MCYSEAYRIIRTSDLTWTVEKEDGDEYYIVWDILKDKFVCSCMWNVLTSRTCRHIRMIMEDIVKLAVGM